MKRLKRPRDPAQLGKLIGDILTGQIKDRVEDKRDPNAVARGRLGGEVGGKARAGAMTKEERSESAKRAAKARWKNH